MRSAQLQRVIDLMRRTGDRCLVFDNDREEGMVLMSIDDYEKILNMDNISLGDLSESEMMDKVNRDISAWKSLREDDFLDDFEKKEIIENVQNSWGEEMGEEEGDWLKDEDEEDALEDDKENDGDEELYYETPVEENVTASDNILTEEEINNITASARETKTGGVEGFFDEDANSGDVFAGRLTKPGTNFEEKIDDLPEDEEETFLVEPV